MIRCLAHACKRLAEASSGGHLIAVGALMPHTVNSRPPAVNSDTASSYEVPQAPAKVSTHSWRSLTKADMPCLSTKICSRVI